MLAHRFVRITRSAIHPSTVEGRLRTIRIGDSEGVLGEGVQGSAGIIEQLKGLVSRVDDGRGDLQVLRSVDVGVGDRCPDSDTRGVGDSGGSRDHDRGGEKCDERSAEGRGEHRGEEGGGG